LVWAAGLVFGQGLRKKHFIKFFFWPETSKTQLHLKKQIGLFGVNGQGGGFDCRLWSKKIIINRIIFEMSKQVPMTKRQNPLPGPESVTWLIRKYGAQEKNYQLR